MNASKVLSGILWTIAALAVLATLAAPFRAAFVFAPSEELDYYELLGQTSGLLVASVIVYLLRRPRGVRLPLLVTAFAAGILLVTMHSLAGWYDKPYPPDHPHLGALLEKCSEGKRSPPCVRGHEQPHASGDRRA